MACLREVITQTLEHGYAHHIRRPMVTGPFALLLGVRPQEVHAWYLSVYVDAVEWVELPSTLGMSQYASGGLMASKPYVWLERLATPNRGSRSFFPRVGRRARWALPGAIAARPLRVSRQAVPRDRRSASWPACWLTRRPRQGRRQFLTSSSAEEAVLAIQERRDAAPRTTTRCMGG